MVVSTLTPFSCMFLLGLLMTATLFSTLVYVVPIGLSIVYKTNVRVCPDIYEILLNRCLTPMTIVIYYKMDIIIKLEILQQFQL